MDNKIVYADELAEAARAAGKNYHDSGVRQESLAGYPVDLGVVTKVTYLDKTDRYSITFGYGATLSSARVTNEVAEYLLTHAKVGSHYGPMPTVNAHMTDGVVDGVLLMFLSREG